MLVCFKQRPGRIKGTPRLKGTGWRLYPTEAGLAWAGPRLRAGSRLGAEPTPQSASELSRAPATALRSGTPATHGAVGAPWPLALQSPEGRSAQDPGSLSAREPTTGAGSWMTAERASAASFPRKLNLSEVYCASACTRRIGGGFFPCGWSLGAGETSR